MNFWHKATLNPVIQSEGILRFLPGNVATSLPLGTTAIATATAGDPGTITITADVADSLPVASTFTVDTSTGNDGTYTVASVAYSDPTTTITTEENLPDGTDDGNITTTAQNAKGLWLGYIDWSLFDEAYTPTVGFYNYETTVEAPVFNIDATGVEFVAGEEFTYTGSGSAATDFYYYKFSYIYDGNQESLLSEETLAWDVSAADKAFRIKFTHNSTATGGWSINPRITAINVYRGITVDANYALISTVDFLRDITERNSQSSGVYVANDMICIPAMGNYNFNSGVTYQINLVAEGDEDIDATADGTGQTVFTLAADTVVTDRWDNMAWTMRIKAGAEIASGSSGAYAGDQTVFLATAISNGKLVGGIMLFNGNAATDTSVILDNVGKAVHTTEELTKADNKAGFAFSVINGLHYSWYVNPNYFTLFYDTLATTEGAPHPLEGEVSIDINAQYAKVVNGRLWQTNLILDPYSSNEKREHWASYSELGQYDVNPASNLMPIVDREAGGMTGIAELFGNPVVLKKQAIFTIYGTRTYPGTSLSWYVRQSTHNIGNIAEEGFITVADKLYICYYDGIYRLVPSNLSDADMTPTEDLKISKPIENIYQALSLNAKTSIRVVYDPIYSEILFYFATQTIYTFHVVNETWRKISTARTVAIFAMDENAEPLALHTSDRKLYSTSNNESITNSIITKSFAISEDREETVRKIAVTYKSASALTLEVFFENDIVSGNIEVGTTYTNNGYTSVTYDGTGYNDTQTFVGVAGVSTYSTAGSGTVELISSTTLPANNAVTTYKVGIRKRGRKFKIKIKDTVSSSTATEIDRITIEADGEIIE